MGGPGNDGVYSVTVTATDGDNAAASTTFTWTVNNPAPVAGDDAFATNEDVAINDSVAGNDNDLDNDVLTYAVTGVGPEHGDLELNADGTFTFTPDENFFGSDTFTYSVTDADGDIATATVSITVNSVNDVPVVTTPIDDQANVDADDVSVNVSGNFADVEGNVTYSASGLPTGLSIDMSTGIISGTIDNRASGGGFANDGIYGVTVFAQDGDGAIVSNGFEWTVSNPAPLAVDDAFNTDEDINLSGSVAGNDSDPDGDGLTFALGASGPFHGMINFNADGSFDYFPDNGFNGPDSFEYTVTDDDGATTTATATINVGAVNDAPVEDTPLGNQSNEDGDLVTVDISVNFSDPDGDTLSFAADNLPPGLSIDAETGVITGVLDSSASAAGPYSVMITVTDGNGGEVVSGFDWTVTNPAPIAGDDSFRTDEDTPINSTVVTDDSDPDGDDLTWTIDSDVSNGTLVLNTDGSFTYTPDGDYSGNDSFTYTLTDLDGATTSATVNITVNPVNDAPIADDDSAVTAEDTLKTIDVLLNDSDIDGGLPTVTIVDGPENGTAIVNNDGTVTYTPDDDYNGPDSFTYQIDDGNGGTDTATVSLNVTPVNDPPVTTATTLQMTEDQTAIKDANAWASDPDGDPLTFSLVTPSDDVDVVIEADGTTTITPKDNFTGTTTFTYRACDGGGLCSDNTITVNVDPVNDAPVANPDESSTSEDRPVRVDLLANDFDVDGDELSIFEIEGQAIEIGETITLPSGVKIRLNADQTIQYIPGNAFDHLAVGQNAVDVFEYSVVDAEGKIATTQVMVTVTGANDGPVAVDDQIETVVNEPVTVAVLGNDYDPDGDPLSVILLTAPDSGTAVVTTSGQIIYTPAPNFEGQVKLRYLVEDPQGSTSIATVTIVVQPRFAFDSFTNFSQDDITRTVGGVDFASRMTTPILSQKIFTLAPEPIFSGYARPGTQIIGRIYDQSGALVGEASSNTDPGGNWMMQFHDARGNDFYRIEFEQVATSGLDVYGYFGMDPANNSYQSMEPLTAYDQPMSVEGAMETSHQTLEQAHRVARDPLGFGHQE